MRSRYCQLDTPSFRINLKNIIHNKITYIYTKYDTFKLVCIVTEKKIVLKKLNLILTVLSSPSRIWSHLCCNSAFVCSFNVSYLARAAAVIFSSLSENSLDDFPCWRQKKSVRFFKTRGLYTTSKPRVVTFNLDKKNPHCISFHLNKFKNWFLNS